MVLLAVSFLMASPPLPAEAPLTGLHWGFWAHKFINRMAVYRLPPEMSPLFKANIDVISENAVNPDRRRYAVIGEAERHFIDLDAYGDSVAFLPRRWDDAVKKYGEEKLRQHGIAPWYLQAHLRQLTESLREKDYERIIRLATDLGHYVGDIHVPLHTTQNYNGQMTGQEGIHAFWESRLPELYANEYDFWIGPVSYLENTTDIIWETVLKAHAACDSVLAFEKKLSGLLPPDKRYTYETRHNALVRMPSQEFAGAYHKMLGGQVERQMKAAIRLVGDLWFTCWVNAGQPVLERKETGPGKDLMRISSDTLSHTRAEADH